MTPNHNHASLFVAAPAAAESDAADQTGRKADDGAEAMRQLRHPFTVPPEQAAETTEPSDRRPHS